MPIGGLYITYHLLREPATTIDWLSLEKYHSLDLPRMQIPRHHQDDWMICHTFRIGNPNLNLNVAAVSGYYVVVCTCTSWHTSMQWTCCTKVESGKMQLLLGGGVDPTAHNTEGCNSFQRMLQSISSACMRWTRNLTGDLSFVRLINLKIDVLTCLTSWTINNYQKVVPVKHDTLLKFKIGSPKHDFVSKFGFTISRVLLLRHLQNGHVFCSWRR